MLKDDKDDSANITWMKVLNVYLTVRLQKENCGRPNSVV